MYSHSSYPSLHPGAAAQRTQPGQPWFTPRESLAVPPGSASFGPYTIRFAQSTDERSAATALRLGCGATRHAASRIWARELAEAWRQDLMVIHRKTEQLVAAARLATVELAPHSSEYLAAHLPARLSEQCVEVVDVCMAAGHEAGDVIALLLIGCARYADWNDKRYVFAEHGLSTTALDGPLLLDLRAEAQAALCRLSAPGHFRCESKERARA